MKALNGRMDGKGKKWKKPKKLPGVSPGWKMTHCLVRE